MSWEMVIVLGLLLVAVGLFASEKLSVDLVTLIMLCILIVTRILTPAEAFAGFSSDILIILGSIFVLGGALQRTGVLDGLAGWMLRLAGRGPRRLTTLLMVSAGSLSAFMNNTTVAAMLIPPVTGLARRSGISASKLLMPLAFAAIMGGTCTLIGTSTNVAVSGYLAHSGFEPLGLFELVPVGFAVLASGTLFMVLVGTRLLRDFEDDAVTDLEEMACLPVDADAGVAVAEAIILPGSELAGGTLSEVEFRQRYGLTVLAVNRSGQPAVVDDLARTALREGDVLLVRGPVHRVDGLLRSSSRFRRLGDPEGPPGMSEGMRRQGFLALGIFAAALVCGSSGWLPMAGAFLIAAVLAIVCGCIPVEKAYEFIEWRLLILVGGMTAFGGAMEKTGAADLLAQWVVAGLGPLGIMAVLGGFFVLTIVLTQPMSNAAAALVVLPVAISAAQMLEAEPRTFGIAVMLAASISFITPLEPACILVYGAGKYRFRDFMVVGGLLTLLLSVVVLALIPLLWKL